MKVYLLGMTRGGTSICGQILITLLSDWYDQYLDIEGQSYEKKETIADFSKLFACSLDNQYKYLLGPYKDNQQKNTEALLRSIDQSQDKIIIITRDPVDCIYSWYYAAKLHNRPEYWDQYTYENPNNFAIQFAKSYYGGVEGLMYLANSKFPLILSYEEITMSPMNFIRQVLEYLDADVSQSNINTASNLMAFFNPIENVKTHRRSGIPGYARKCLDPTVIKEIDCIFAKFNNTFDYPSREISNQEIKYMREISSLRDSLKELMTKYAQLEQRVKQMLT